jgi:hypothetical protein
MFLFLKKFVVERFLIFVWLPKNGVFVGFTFSSDNKNYKFY